MPLTLSSRCPLIPKLVATIALACVGAFAQAAFAASEGTLEPLDLKIEHAEAFVSSNLLSKVRNINVAFHWIGGRDRFWFRKALADGTTAFIVVDAATGVQKSLFDQAAMKR